MLRFRMEPSVLPDTSISFSEGMAPMQSGIPHVIAFFQFYVADGKIACLQYIKKSAEYFYCFRSTLHPMPYSP